MDPEKNIDEILDRYITSASKEDVESHCDLVFQHLRSKVHHARQGPTVAVIAFSSWGRTSLVSAAAAVLLAVVIGAWWRSGALAIAENIDGTLIRSVEGKAQSIQVGDAFGWGDTVHADSGATFRLADGSRVEMRAQSELGLEQADDGVRIRLNKGGILVSAAKQRDGHLYVQTKDMTVSVVGTVFLVNAEEEGSRVAVIEGEVRMRQDTTDMKLLPGEQVATSPLMESIGVKEEISWSRHAEEHLALLQQSSVSAGAALSTESRDVFELATIRPLPVVSGGGGAAATDPLGCRSGGWFGAIQIDPTRIVIPAITLAALVNMAYAQDCFLVEGGPEWIRSDRFDIQGLIPGGSPVYTRRDLTEGKATKLQNMLQNLLLDRFKLVVRREMKEMSVYTLVVVKDGKLKFSEDQTPPDTSILPIPRRGGPLGRGSMSLLTTSSGDVIYSANAVPVWEVTKILQGQVGRAVIDKTELKGLFDIRLQFARESPPTATGPGVQIAPQTMPYPTGPLLPAAIQEQLGLKLVSARAPVEVLVIDRVERPSEN